MYNKISIIMPAYNCENYVSKAIDSVIAQIYNNWELIIIDDGSTDDTGKICDEYEKQDCRVHVFHVENQGVSNARNKGINLASGEFITFLDSDDWIKPEMYFEMLTAFNENVDIVVCGFTTVYENKYSKKVNYKKVNPGTYKNITAVNLLCCNGYVCNKVYRKTALKTIRFTKNVKIEEDWIFNIKVFASSSKEIKFITEEYYYYYQRSDSVLHSKKFLDAIETLEEIRSMLKCVKYNTIYNVLWHEYYSIIGYSLAWALENGDGKWYYDKMQVNLRKRFIHILLDFKFSLKDRGIYFFYAIFPYSINRYLWLLKNH